MKYLAALVLMTLAAGTVLAFDGERARAILDSIASDAYEGRGVGTEGGRRAEYDMAMRLSRYQVYPAADAGYFQTVPLLATEEIKADLTLLDHPLGSISFADGVDFTVMTHSGSGDLTAPVVVAGYGYVRPDKDRDDYDSVDVRGKIVLIVRGTPDGPYDFSQDIGRKHTLQWAKERGAAAVLYYQDPKPVMGAAIPAESYSAKFPLLYVGDRLLGLLLDGTGYSVETYKANLKEGPLPVFTGKRVHLRTVVGYSEYDHARNVLGIIYGTDRELKNEIVVVGAHLDHVGRGSHGLIYNGADDNGSGSAILSELAREFADKPCRRSIIVMHFTGEENGLLGSDYWVKHPSVPLANLVGMVNLDMEGMGAGDIAMVGGEQFGHVWDQYTNGLDSAALSHIKMRTEEGHGASDYASFMDAGVPTVAFWSRGDHPFYHSYTDRPERISTAALQAVGTQAEAFIRFLADHDGSLACHADTALSLSRLTMGLDFSGVTVDAIGTVPDVRVATAAWLPSVAQADILKRISDLRFACDAKNVVCSTVKDALSGRRNQKQALFLGVTESDLNSRRAPDVASLAREGVAFVKLGPGISTDKGLDVSAGMAQAKKEGFYALVPFDFASAPRIEYWKKHALVTGTLTDFAAAPQDVRDGLLKSDALLILDVNETPTATQIEAVRPGAARRVHFNFGDIPVERRELHTWLVMKALLAEGVSRDDILLLTGGNLRRFFDL
jgi:aminopeptidase YwaD